MEQNDSFFGCFPGTYFLYFDWIHSPKQLSGDKKEPALGKWRKTFNLELNLTEIIPNMQIKLIIAKRLGLGRKIGSNIKNFIEHVLFELTSMYLKLSRSLNYFT